MPPSFASAAASSNPTSTQARDGASDWARRSNGATQTFRRSSGATSVPPTTQAQPDGSVSGHLPPRYVPPHRNGTLNDMRYSKEQLFDLFKSQQSSEGALKDGLPNLYVGGWQPEITNGASSASWGRVEHNRDTQPGPEICWDRDGAFEPLGLLEMDDEERELFLTSVNTPLKPPVTSNKDNPQSNGLPARKMSFSSSANNPGVFGLPSPSLPRGLGRRRETSESLPPPTNPLASPTSNREDQRAPSPPASLVRRRTDLKDPNRAEDREAESDEKMSNPFGSLKRNTTAPLGTGFQAPSSPWSTAPSAGMSPMGSFGNFGLGGQQGVPSEKRTGAGSGRSESRFKNLLNKEGGEDVGQRPVERKASISGLSRVNENESWRPHERQDLGQGSLPEAEEDVPTGSAALAANSDMSPQHLRQAGRGFGTPNRTGTHDDFGFGAFGMTSDNAPGFGQGFLHGRESFQQTPSNQRMGHQTGAHEPMSPTDTNPYQSPEQHSVNHLTDDHDTDGSDMNPQLSRMGGFSHEQSQQLGLGTLGNLPNLGRAPGVPGPAGDRSQTSSAGPHRGFLGLGGISQLGGTPGGWPVSQPGFGTPGRPTAGLSTAFGGGIFANSMAEMQPSGLAGLGSNTLAPQATGNLGGSRMAGMFPPAMQDQIRHGEREGSNERAGQSQSSGFGGEMGRDSDSPFRTPSDFQTSQGITEPGEKGHFGAPGQQQPQSTTVGYGPGGQSNQQQQQPPVPQQPPSSASNQPPQPQQRTMVMPDRMRWIYRDPQGQTQGPWSGLEMHDWYKAGFFSPELLVKKFEEPDYEPLAQLIRRIGNSREPFLVPQIGIPHGPASNNGPTAWAGTGTQSAAATVATTAIASPGGAQPPFASSFPSFGTTLTADQQNALERRKQEEQYLMARQKEHLAQAQIQSRMHGGHPNLMAGQLHHHSSAHSLHSQPSFGSMTSPNVAFQASPVQGPTAGGPAGHAAGFFDNSFRGQQVSGLGAVGAGVDSLGHIREEEIPNIMDRLDLGSRPGQGQFGAPGQSQQVQQAGQDAHEQQVYQMMQDRARLRQEQAQHDDTQQRAEVHQTASHDRLQQFQQLQGQGAGPGTDARFQGSVGKQGSEQKVQTQPTSVLRSAVGSSEATEREQTYPQERLSLTEQVQKAASAHQDSSAPPQQHVLPAPFPPAPSQSPLPAPAAQRTGRQSFAEQLHTQSRDNSQTPPAETPSSAIAPWAKEPAEAPKGPSLREIQEMEAKKAAQAAEVESAARRVALQKEIEAQAHAAAPLPGLPASASWAAGGSPSSPAGTAGLSPWAKTAQKPSGPATAKSMAQIQKEEEARKRKQVAALASAQASAAGVVAVPTSGKSYANLAGKVSAPTTGGNVSSAWTTVGASGKTKPPAPTPAAAPTRAVSAGVVSTMPSSGSAKKAATRNATANPGAINAQDEFRKWATGELRPDLNKGIAVDDFVAGLLVLPQETEMITEAVHGVSSTIDSRHFAEEFIRRKRLADKGLVDHSTVKSASPSHAAGHPSGGWSEVAKKGPAKEPSRDESNGSFRVVAAKKKGGKR